MTLTYILPTVPNRNEWKLCEFLHVVNYMPIIIHVSQNNFRVAGDPTPYWSACSISFVILSYIMVHIVFVQHNIDR